VNLSVLPTLGRNFRPVWRKNSAAEEKSKTDKSAAKFSQKELIRVLTHQQFCCFHISLIQTLIDPGPIILKNVDNTCRRAKKCLKGLFTGKQTNALVNVYYIILAPVGVILEHLRCPENVGFCYSM